MLPFGRRGRRCRFWFETKSDMPNMVALVGASLLAKNDNADILNVRGALKFFASKLAPTGIVHAPQNHNPAKTILTGR